MICFILLNIHLYTHEAREKMLWNIKLYQTIIKSQTSNPNSFLFGYP